MSHGFLPRTDATLLNWAKHFSEKISASFEEYGLTEQQAEDFAAAYEAYREKLRISGDPVTRTRPAVSAKDAARAALRDIAGTLNKIIQANPDLTDEQKLILELSVAKNRSRINAPSEPPTVWVTSVFQQRVSIQVQRSTEKFSKRGRPDGAIGALVLTYCGDAAPADLSQWQLGGLFSKSSVDLQFPATLAPGTKVWIVARWFTSRMELGPTSMVVSTHLQGGGMDTSSLRLAA